MADYRRASHYPVSPSTYDGNGKIHPIEAERGVKLVPDKSGKGYRKVGNTKEGKVIATLQDDSATKQLAELESVKKDNAATKLENAKLKSSIDGYSALVKDMDKRLRELEDKKDK